MHNSSQFALLVHAGLFPTLLSSYCQQFSVHFRQLDTAEENNIVGSKMHDNRTIPFFS